jgi:HEPN/Toprim N-terminal domain 1
MVSACVLRFDDVSIAEQKAYVPDDFIYLFQESDRRAVQHVGTSDEEPDVGYFSPRSVILHRLDLAGYTAERARQGFQSWLDQTRRTYAGCLVNGDGWAGQIAAELKGFSYEEWKRRARDVLLTRYDFTRPRDVYVDEIDRMMRGLGSELLFFGDDMLAVIRAMLEAFPDVREVSLDIGPLIFGGWIEPNGRICEERRASGHKRVLFYSQL